MTATLMVRGLAFSLFGLALMGCQKCPVCSETPGTPPPESRGTFGAGSCDSSTRVGVPGNAVMAVYYDSSGQIAGTNAEELDGTTSNKMCPLPEFEGPGACPAGYCPIPIAGKTYCRKC
jgi:hypothetical protein